MKIPTIVTVVAFSLVRSSVGFSTVPHQQKGARLANQHVVDGGKIFYMAKNDENQEPKKKGFFGDLLGMFENFDDVVDDFVYKRMGAGEQWYGKRKYNPSGKFDGDYNGMGRSDQFRIELARVQKEEMEKRRQRRLEEEEARRNS